MQGAGGGWERAGPDAGRPGRTARTPAPVVQGNEGKGMSHALKPDGSTPLYSFAPIPLPTFRVFLCRRFRRFTS